MNRWLDLRLGACVLVVALGTAAAWHALAPRTYVASARVIMVPDGGAASRIVKLESAALDPAEARSHLSSQLVGYPAASLIDAPSIASPGRNLTLDLAIGGGLGLAFGAALTVWQARRRRPVRKERDLLPLLEGTTVATKHGPVKTDHILFIASGAFHLAKPSDLLPELQGCLPIRVELKPLTRDDFRLILTEPEAA